MNVREREPHRTRAKNELKHNSNSPLVRAEAAEAASAGARSRSVDEVVFDDQWRLETSLLVRVCVRVGAGVGVVRVVSCWLLGNFAAHTLRCCVAAAAAEALHGPFLAWTAQQRKNLAIYTHIDIFSFSFCCMDAFAENIFLSFSFDICWLLGAGSPLLRLFD